MQVFTNTDCYKEIERCLSLLYSPGVNTELFKITEQKLNDFKFNTNSLEISIALIKEPISNECFLFLTNVLEHHFKKTFHEVSCNQKELIYSEVLCIITNYCNYMPRKNILLLNKCFMILLRNESNSLLENYLTKLKMMIEKNYHIPIVLNIISNVTKTILNEKYKILSSTQISIKRVMDAFINEQLIKVLELLDQANNYYQNTKSQYSFKGLENNHLNVTDNGINPSQICRAVSPIFQNNSSNNFLQSNPITFSSSSAPSSRVSSPISQRYLLDISKLDQLIVVTDILKCINSFMNFKTIRIVNPNVIMIVFSFATIKFSLSNNDLQGLNDSKNILTTISIKAIKCLSSIVTNLVVLTDTNQFSNCLAIILEKLIYTMRLVTRVELNNDYIKYCTSLVNFADLLLTTHFTNLLRIKSDLCLTFIQTFGVLIHSKISNHQDILLPSLRLIQCSIMSLSTSNAYQHQQQINDVLQEIIVIIFKKSFIVYNFGDIIQTIDDREDDNDELDINDFNKLQRALFDTLVIYSENHFHQAYSLMAPFFLEILDYISNLTHSIYSNNQTNESMEKINYLSKDSFFIIHLFGRIMPIFVFDESKYEQNAQLINPLVEKLCVFIGSSLQAVDIISINNNKNTHYASMLGECFCFLSMICPWFKVVHDKSNNLQWIQQVIMGLCHICYQITINQNTNTTILCQNSMMFLHSITSIVRPTYFFLMEPVQKICDSLQKSAYDHFPINILSLIYKIIIQSLSLPWFNLPDNKQDWDNRSSNLQIIIKIYVNRFLEEINQLLKLSNCSNRIVVDGELITSFSNNLTIFKFIIESIQNESSRCQSIVIYNFQSIINILNDSLINFKIVLTDHSSVFFQIIEINLSIIKVFNILLTANHFFTFFQSLIHLIEKNAYAKPTDMEKVFVCAISILIELYKMNSNNYTKIIPQTLQFIEYKLLPIFSQEQCYDSKIAIIDMLSILLNNHSKLLQVKSSINQNITLHICLLEFLIRSLSIKIFTPDLYKQCIALFKNLNSKSQFFAKVFNMSMINEFGQNLTLSLIESINEIEYCSLRDDIFQMIFEICHSINDFSYIHKWFIMATSNKTSITNDSILIEIVQNIIFNRNIDFSTFSSLYNSVLNDYGYYCERNL